MKAPKPGALPADGAPIIADVKLPRGKRIAPHPGFSDSAQAPVLWITESPAGGLFAPLAAAFPQTGLWPVLLESATFSEERPWLSGELDTSAVSLPDEYDAAEVLAERWPDELGEFPGLTAATTQPAHPIAGPKITARLGLVPVTRPADVVAAVGWCGPANHYDDIAELASVLRSWEERFGAYVVGIGFDTLTLCVTRPTMTMQHTLAVAREHYAACPDNIEQGPGTVQRYAEGILAQPVWQLWWD